ncbi:MBL fold metallo-hydrolase [candidate division KSB1 bacterium]|nr:MBL fold metallo-hydrolase [candidate division KSB1 bacterium]
MLPKQTIHNQHLTYISMVWILHIIIGKGSIIKYTFLGTRGYIEKKSDRHRRHSAFLISNQDHKVMIDCGEDWINRLSKVDPDALLITHAHPDHVGGLKKGAPWPVYSHPDAADELKAFEIETLRIMEYEEAFTLYDIVFQAFAVEHSKRAAAAGYKIKLAETVLFYIPDVVYIHNREKALKNVDIYIGDGSTVEESFVRKSDGRLVGHTPFRTQLTWCKKFDIPRAYVTHCGTLFIEKDERTLGARLRKMGKDRGVEVKIAHDGMEINLPTNKNG